MALIGRIHPLLIHFPIALLIAAAAAEAAATTTGSPRWHQVAVVNAYAGAAFAGLAVAAGWQLSFAPAMEPTSLLAWHKWLGTSSGALAAAAALTSLSGRREWRGMVWGFRITLLGAAILVAIAGHLGGLMVWGADFLRP
jgi:uncharacterized membrane protein